MVSVTENNPIPFVKITILILGICNVFFIGGEYQASETLDIFYFYVVLILFVISLLWALGIILVTGRAESCILLEVIYHGLASLLYLAGVCCFIAAFTKKKTDRFPAGTIISSILGFLCVIFYACGSLLLFYIYRKSSKDSDV